MIKKLHLAALLSSQLAALPVEVAEQLQTASGAKALADSYQDQVADASAGAGERHVYRKRAEAAQQMAAHLGYADKVRDIEKTIARDKTAATQEFEACRISLADAIDAATACAANSAAIAIKVEDIQATVTAQEQKLNDAALTAREAFNNVMTGDDDDAQRLAAEHLSQTETALHLAKQSSPDVLRLNGFTVRAVHADEAAHAAASKVETAKEALNQAVLKAALVDLDASTSQLLLDHARTLNALADCKKRPYLNGFDSIVLWFSTGNRFANPGVQMGEAAVVVAQHSLMQPARALRMPDLSVFADK